MQPNPFLTVWTKPRETIRRIVAENPKKHLFVLPFVATALAGAGAAFANPQLVTLLHLPAAVLAVVLGVVGGICNFLGIWVIAVLVRWTGLLLKGQATTTALRAALTWGYLPLYAMSAVGFLVNVFAGESLYRYQQAMQANPPADMSGMGGIIALSVVLAIVGFAANIWTTVIASKTVAEVQGFRSAWKGFLNLLFPALIIIVPIIGILTSVVLVNLNSARQKEEDARDRALENQQRIEQQIEAEGGANLQLQ